jgi:hypothetical protein
MIRTAAVCLALSAAPAMAQDMTCDFYPALAEMLTTQYGEMPLERGLDWRGNMMEWWGNPETGTWSLVTFTADGFACIPAHGELHESVEPVALGIDG